MLTFLFWNRGGQGRKATAPRAARQREQRLQAVVANLTRRHQVDLLMLAECPVARGDVLEAINLQNPTPFSPPDPNSVCERIAIFPRFPQSSTGESGP
jgi:hypothetical protein